MTTTETTLTYRGDPDLKATLVADMREHQRLDRLVQGKYLWPDGKGCAVGCTISGRLLAELGSLDAVEEHVRMFGGWNATWAQVTGLPVWLGRLDDTVFEGLAMEDARVWPVRVLDAVPVGVDIGPVRDLILRDLVMDPDRGAVACAATYAGAGRFPELALAAELRAVPFDAPYDAVRRAFTGNETVGGAVTAACSAVAAAGRADAAHAAFASASAASSAAYWRQVDGGAACGHDPAGDARDTHWAWIADMVIGHLSAAGGVTS